MFTYSTDKLVRKEQKNKELKCFKLLKQCVKIKHSAELETLIENSCDSPIYIVDFVKSIKTNNFRSIVSMICREDDALVKADFKEGLKLTGKHNYDYIPYAKMSFNNPDYVNNIHVQHVYLLFFNKYNKFEDSLAETLYQFKRLNKMKMFI